MDMGMAVVEPMRMPVAVAVGMVVVMGVGGAGNHAKNVIL